MHALYISGKNDARLRRPIANAVYLRGDGIIYALQQGCSEAYSMFSVFLLLDDF